MRLFVRSIKVLIAQIRFVFYRALYDFKNQELPADFSLKSVKSIVVSKMDGKLGDSVMLSPLFTELRKYRPDIKISVICTENIAVIFRNCLRIESCLTLPKKPAKKELDGIIGRILENGPCDMLVSLEQYLRFKDFYLFRGLRPGYIAGRCSRVKSVNICLDRLLPPSHLTKYIAFILEKLGVEHPDLHYKDLATSEALAKAAAYCRPDQITLAPWGASRARRLRDGVILEAVKFISANSHNSVCLLIPPEGNYLKALIRRELPEVSLIATPEKMDCTELAAIIHLSRGVISVNTANLHLACASAVPLLGIYQGDKRFERENTVWRPYTTQHNLLICEKSGCKIKDLSFNDLKASLTLFLRRLREESPTTKTQPA